MGFNTPYLFLLAFYMLLFFIELFNLSNLKVKRIVRYISGITFFVFFGFRGYIGSDWFNYEISYSLTSWEYWLLSDYEPGFSALAKSFKYIGLNYFIFVAFITGLQVWLFDKFIVRYSMTIPLCYILLIALFPIAILDLQRNFLSILIVVNGFHYLESNNLKKFYIYVIIGIMFHLSAVIFFIIPIIRKSVFKKWILILFLLIGIVVYFSQLNFYNTTLLFIGSIFGGGVEDLILQATGDNETAYGLSIGILEKFLFFLLLIVLYPKIKTYPPLVVNACFIYLLVNIYFSTSQTFINRFAILFFWGYMLVYCYVVKFLLSKRIYSFMMMILLFSFMRTYFSYNNILYDYKNVLFQEDDRYKRRMNRMYFYENR